MDGRETWLSWRAAPRSAILPVQEIESENVTVNACTTSAVDIGAPMFQTLPLLHYNSYHYHYHHYHYYCYYHYHYYYHYYHYYFHTSRCLPLQCYSTTINTSTVFAIHMNQIYRMTDCRQFEFTTMIKQFKTKPSKFAYIFAGSDLRSVVEHVEDPRELSGKRTAVQTAGHAVQSALHSLQGIASTLLLSIGSRICRRIVRIVAI
jgi:hypothetical protein